MTHEEKRRDPTEDILLNMKPGALIVVFYGNYSCKGIFGGFKSQTTGMYEGLRMHYYSLYNSDFQDSNVWIKNKLAEWKVGKGRPYLSQIHAHAERRVFPIGEEMLSEYEKEYYNVVKELI